MTEMKNANSHIPGCIRKMTNTERVFYMYPGCNVAVVARIRGTISEPDLRRALEKVLRMHPFIGAKIVVDGRHDAWFSDDNVPPPPLRVVQRTSDTQWFSEMKSEQRIPFDLGKGPLIRFVLIHSPDISDLVIVCNHTICDGMALANLVRDLLELYANPGQEITVLSPPDMMDFLPKNGGISLKVLLTRLFTTYGNWKWRKSPHYFSQEDYDAIITAYWEKWDYGAVLLKLEPEETASLSARCRNEGVTIGSAITAACIAAHEDITGAFAGNFRVVSIPFDLRRHATPPVGDVFCLCVGGSQFSFTYQSEKPFWENVSVLHAEIHKRVEKLDSAGMEVPDFDPSFIDAFACFASLKKSIPEAYTRTVTLSRFSRDTKNIAFSFARNYEKITPGTIASNLGRLNIPDTYGDLRIESITFLPPVSNSMPLVLGGVSIGGRLVYSMTFAEPKENLTASREPDMIRIRNRALEYLGFPEKVSDNALESVEAIHP